MYVIHVQLNNTVFVSLDIDECATGAHNCKSNERCINRHGHFTCRCADGYRLVNDLCEGMYGSFIALMIR